tara:strand:+ start:54 stop:401 length:348 start_codon:yes stop_codon:yes gene_type:complete
MKKRTKKVLGAVMKEEIEREREFKRRLKNFFPDSDIAFVYNDIAILDRVSQKIKDEGVFGYNKRESILLDGQSIKIAWLPHVKDMPTSYIETIVERIVEAVDERVATDNVSISCC